LRPSMINGGLPTGLCQQSIRRTPAQLEAPAQVRHAQKSDGWVESHDLVKRQAQGRADADDPALR
jgi:hypothetical protein